MIRQFELINELGQSFGLNDVRRGFLQNPTGLGYSMEYSFAKMGISWQEQYMRDTQATISGEVVFATTSPYEAQQSFLKFVRESKSVSLKRTTPAGAYYKDVAITSYAITEITEGNVLSCPINMIAKSLWYIKTSTKVDIISTASSSTRYSYMFPSSFNDYANGYLSVDNDGSVGAAFTVEMYGALANPVITIEVNGTEVSRVEINSSISSGQRIIYSSKDGNLYCYKGTDSQIEGFKRNGVIDGLTNLVSGMSLSNENFFKIPTGESKLHVTADSALTNSIFVEIFKSYRAV